MNTFIDLLQQSFVENAFIAGTLIAIVSAIIGYFVVLRAQAFAAHALSHVGFAGATLAAVFGISGLLGMAAFTVAAALGMGALGKRIRGRDVEIGMILSFALGLGVLFLRLYTNSSSETVSVLFGSILSVTHTDIILTLVFGIGTLIILAAIFRQLLFSSIDPEVAEAAWRADKNAFNTFYVFTCDHGGGSDPGGGSPACIRAHRGACGGGAASDAQAVFGHRHCDRARRRFHMGRPAPRARHQLAGKFLHRHARGAHVLCRHQNRAFRAPACARGA